MVLAENARCTFKIKYWDHHRVLGFDYGNLFVVSFKVRMHGTGESLDIGGLMAITGWDFSQLPITSIISPWSVELLCYLPASWDTSSQQRSSRMKAQMLTWIQLSGSFGWAERFPVWQQDNCRPITQTTQDLSNGKGLSSEQWNFIPKHHRSFFLINLSPPPTPYGSSLKALCYQVRNSRIFLKDGLE